MTDLSTREQKYLVSAFEASPSDWFRPRSINRQSFSDREIDQIVAALNQRGVMQGEPELHARLTDRGRKEASQLSELANRDWRSFYKRRKTRIAVASTVAALLVSIVVLKLAGIV